ncbi:MAG: hypothetical protein Q8R81_03475 [Novosphingobium sp.]|uniref:hypothetical protein n=1 Tax=Novosphingobium sp. TaxID=1874826 RepID=UPI000BD03547|nr:hypothetical protein [Novosphingobium sp.]MDP3549439.1 hypothetical protein [Novosphingobium sp.]OZA30855.1 MAG: hypothetical protein B7X92_15535 [Novosphingobium sp. 17-62-9]
MRIAATLALCLVLAACGSPQVEQDGAPLDPVMAEALQGQLMVDPDLSQQNMRNLAITPGGPIDPALPLPDPAN